jgi:hypothetical protein
LTLDLELWTLDFGLLSRARLTMLGLFCIIQED